MMIALPQKLLSKQLRHPEWSRMCCLFTITWTRVTDKTVNNNQEHCMKKWSNAFPLWCGREHWACRVCEMDQIPRHWTQNYACMQWRCLIWAKWRVAQGSVKTWSSDITYLFVLNKFSIALIHVHKTESWHSNVLSWFSCLLVRIGRLGAMLCMALHCILSQYRFSDGFFNRQHLLWQNLCNIIFKYLSCTLTNWLKEIHFTNKSRNHIKWIVICKVNKLFV